MAGSGIRVNLVAPGLIETGMLNRFTGSEEVKASLAAGVPMKREGLPEESQVQLSCSPRTRLPLSRVYPMRWMVIKPPLHSRKLRWPAACTRASLASYPNS